MLFVLPNLKLVIVLPIVLPLEELLMICVGLVFIVCWLRWHNIRDKQRCPFLWACIDLFNFRLSHCLRLTVFILVMFFYFQTPNCFYLVNATSWIYFLGISIIFVGSYKYECITSLLVFGLIVFSWWGFA